MRTRAILLSYHASRVVLLDGRRAAAASLGYLLLSLEGLSTSELAIHISEAKEGGG
jgi:hypothetical protein